MICVCTRLAQAKFVRDRYAHTLLIGLQDMWFRPYGAPTVLDSDQEGAFRSDIANIVATGRNDVDPETQEHSHLDGGKAPRH